MTSYNFLRVAMTFWAAAAMSLPTVQAQEATKLDIEICNRASEPARVDKHCTLVLKTYPTLPVTKSTAATAAYKLGNSNLDKSEYQEALTNFEKAIEFRPENPFDRLGHGRALAALKQYKKAFDDFIERFGEFNIEEEKNDRRKNIN